MESVYIQEVNPENVMQETLFCIKDTKSPGFQKKHQWFLKRFEEGLKLKILKSAEDKPLAFIEYIPAQYAWRPIDAGGYMFIHCMYVYSNKDKQQGYGSMLVRDCVKDAESAGMKGVATMCSKGSWVADKRLFEKNGFSHYDKQGRFELMAKKFNLNDPDPRLIDWRENRKDLQGWHLVYANQCPWHEKAVEVIKETAAEHGFDITIRELKSAEEAKSAPSGFGVFSLVHDGELLEDHYISKTRFENIIKKELSNS
jgi:L-amino acid N-acyltransferase YncA